MWSGERSALIAIGIAGATLLFHLYHVFADMNANPKRNLRRAERQSQQGMSRLVEPGDSPFTPPGNPSNPAHYWLAMAIGMLDLFVLISALIFEPLTNGSPFWLCQIAGIVLLIWSGSAFGNAALRMKKHSNPREIVELDTTQVLDDTVPDDFQKKVRGQTAK